jgi:hypothetical protein
MNDEKIVFIRKKLPKKDIYHHWLKHLDLINELTKLPDNYEIHLSIGYLLFPLVDAISYTLFDKSGRFYLEELGIKRSHFLYKMFRNGQLHNLNNYILEYVDGKITWGMGSTGGSEGITPFDPGYVNEQFPELNRPAETVFEFVDLDHGKIHASLSLDRLAALIRYDLERRLKEDPKGTVGLIIGQKMEGKRPSATKSK